MHKYGCVEWPDVLQGSFPFHFILSDPFLEDPVSTCEDFGQAAQFTCTTQESSILFWYRERAGESAFKLAENDIVHDPEYDVNLDTTSSPPNRTSTLTLKSVAADMSLDAYYCEVQGLKSDRARLLSGTVFTCSLFDWYLTVYSVLICKSCSCFL